MKTIKRTLVSHRNFLYRIIPSYINMTRGRLAEILPDVAVLIRPRLQIDNKTMAQLHILQDIFEANNLSSSRVLKTVRLGPHPISKCLNTKSLER